MWYNRLKVFFLKEVLDPEYLYLSVIRTLMYLTNNTRRDIAFQ
jgi:phage tail sheath gpL-like